MLMGSSWIGLSIFLFLATNRYVIVQFLLSRLTCTCTFYRKNWVYNYFFWTWKNNQNAKNCLILENWNEARSLFANLMTPYTGKTKSYKTIEFLPPCNIFPLKMFLPQKISNKQSNHIQNKAFNFLRQKQHSQCSLTSHQVIHTSQITR